ncbi:MAG: purine-binding chemotaxis protein CheW [Calditrichaeota bacterium]|nr:MAG: purine-binding chemotaxis protein CheW [Calditrichota bacterium]
MTSEQSNSHAILFSVADQFFALPLSMVEHVIQAVAITPVPHAPDFIEGVINLHGQLVPVLNLRKRMGFPARAPELSDRLVILHTRQRLLALLVDGVSGVIEWPESEPVTARTVLPDSTEVQGFLPLSEGIVLVADPEHLYDPRIHGNVPSEGLEAPPAS